jgi:hypothetical protein
MLVHRGTKMFGQTATFCYIWHLLYYVHAYKHDGLLQLQIYTTTTTTKFFSPKQVGVS